MLRIILASKSPRRQQLLKGLGVSFEVVTKEVDESFPSGLSPREAVSYIARKKALAFGRIPEDTLLIVADTIVVIDQEILGKPESREAAVHSLRRLSGRRHEVITAVGLATATAFHLFQEMTEVYFKDLSDSQIDYYIDTCRPYDKAGAYGIQEWIGSVAIEKINGSYNNVVGLPTSRLYDELIGISPGLF